MLPNVYFEMNLLAGTQTLFRRLDTSGDEQEC